MNKIKLPIQKHVNIFTCGLLVSLLMLSCPVRASISAGDIAVIGWNAQPASSTKTFAVVVLASIPAGEVIFFTDKGITAGVFQNDLTTEGIFTLTTSSIIEAGTVIQFSLTSGTTPSVTSSPSVGTLTVTNGWTNTTTFSPFGLNGDQILIFQGSVASPTFIFGFNASTNAAALVNGWYTGTSSANSYSEIPAGLTNGTNAVSHSTQGAGAFDNYVYTGTRTGTKATLLAAICTASNWVGNDATAYNTAPGGTQFPGTNPIFTFGTSNGAPTDIALSASSVNENVASNSTIGALSTTDPNSGNTFTYTLVSGTGDTDNASFNISGANLKITNSPDFETKSNYSVRIRTTDQGGLTYEEAFTITINNQNETPTDLALSASSVNENVSANSTVGALSTTDADAGNTFTYTLITGTGDTDNASFNISGGNLRITNSPNFETKNSYSVRIRTTDQGSLSYEEAFSVTINNTNEAPTDLALSASSINENVTANATVGALTSTDVDAANTFTYTLVAGTGDTDNASFNISGSNLRITSSPDFETKNSYSVRVRTADQGSLTYEEAFTITITDVAESVTGPDYGQLYWPNYDDNKIERILVGGTGRANLITNAASDNNYGPISIAVDIARGKIYWLEDVTPSIKRSNLDGTAVETFVSNPGYAYTLVIDAQNSKLYWPNYEDNKIERINLDGTGRADVVTNAASDNTFGPISIALDITNGKIYWLEDKNVTIKSANLDGTSVQTFISDPGYAYELEIDQQNYKLYWPNYEGNKIERINLDGTGRGDVVTNVASDNAFGPICLALDATNSKIYYYEDKNNSIKRANLDGSSVETFIASTGYPYNLEIPVEAVAPSNSAPTDITLSASSISENVLGNSTIGTLSSTDPNASNTFTYTLVAGTGDTDNAAFNISGGNLRITNSPNYESKSSYSIRIRTSDQGNLSYDEAFTITINNVNETPTDLALSASSINENVSANSTVGTLSSTDADAGNTFTYTLVTGTGDTDNASFNISSGNLRITNSPDFETKSSYTVRVRTTDQGSLTYEEAFTITINNQNETPTDLALSASSINENVSGNSTLGALSSTDADAGNTFTYTLVTGTGDTDNASFNISGGNLRITNTPNFESKSSYTVRVRTTDQGSLTYEEAFTITINNLNETPTDLALSASSINENASANSTVGTLSSTDADAANTFTYTLVSGTGDTDNAFFNISSGNLRITNSPDFESKSSYNVRIRTTDQGSLTYEKAFTITINNQNEAPTDLTLSATAVNDGAPANTSVGAFSTIDGDAANTFTYSLVTGTGDTDNASFNISGNNLRITSSPDYETKSSYSIRIRTSDQGTLTYEEVFTITILEVNVAPTDISLSSTSISENVSDNTTVGSLNTLDSNAGNTFAYTLVSGTGGTDNASFNISGGNLKITNSPDFETKSNYSVRIRTTDQGSLTYEEAFTITINNQNETPTDLALSASSINENVSGNSTVGALSSTDADGGNTFTYTLVTGTGDTDNASFNISSGNLRITNSPDFESKSSYSVRVRTTDQGSLTYEEAFTITINNQNETPTDLALSASFINENVSANATLGTLGSTDADTGDTFTYTLVTGTGDTDNGSFNISGGNLRITTSPDYETKNSYSIRIRTTDQNSLTYEEAFTISINNVNETPTDIALSASSINENAMANAIIGTLSAVDPDAANTFTYTLVTGTGDTDNGSFNVSGSNLRITNSPDFESKNSYSLRVRTTDQGSLTYEEAFTITINNQNETPTDLALSGSSINENVSANATIGTLSSTDADAGNTFTYTLVTGTGDTDNASFNISGGNLGITNSPDFETKSSYSVRVRTTDQGSLTYEEAFTITINNQNETPTDLALSASAVNENVSANATIGALSSTDADAGNTFTYTLVSGTGDTDNASFNISGGNLRITNSPNFESKDSYSVRVRTTDQGSLTYEEVFTITINNQNETATDLALSAYSINENVSANSIVGTLSSTDADVGNTFTYTLVTGTGDTDNSSFNISGGNLRITNSPDFESKSSYSVRVRTTDQGSLTYEEAFTITINNENEAPVDINLTALSINENVLANSAVGTLSSTDPDAGNTFTYKLVAGTGDSDNASFTIIGNSLHITGNPDFETANSYSVRINAADQDGLNHDKTFTISIIDVNEVPTRIAISSSSIDESVAANSTVGIFETTDPDASNTFTYTLVSGDGDGDNPFFNISGDNLRITASPDFASQNSYDIRIRSTDQGGLHVEKSLTITVNEINEAPTDLALSAFWIDENVPANTAIGTLSAIDANTVDAFSYTLVVGTGDTDNSVFQIIGDILHITTSPNFENKSIYSVRIKTTDHGGLTFEKQFTVNIIDIVEYVLPSVTTSDISVIGHSTAALGGAVTNDGGATVTETGIVYNTAGAPTTLDTKVQIGGGTGPFSAAVTGLAPTTTYFVRAYAINAAGTSYGNEVSFTTPVENHNPSDILLSNTAIDENATENRLVGTLSSDDADGGDTFTYALVSGTGDADNSAFTIGGNNLHLIQPADFETQPTYTIRVRTTDPGGLSLEKTFTITVNDIDERVPNALFPNGSDQNRTWGVSHLGLEGKVKINVLDSNGHLVFATENPQQEWDGTKQGKQVPEDVYFYTIILSNGTKLQGSLQVIY